MRTGMNFFRMGSNLGLISEHGFKLSFSIKVCNFYINNVNKKLT
jgi:hypothetical protein